MNYNGLTSSEEDGAEVKLTQEMLNELIEFCKIARSRQEMQEFCSIKSDEYFRSKVVNPMLALGLVKMTIPDKSNSRNQKYIRA